MLAAMPQADFERIQDDGWRQGIDTRPLTCTGTGFFRRKFHQYERDRGYRPRWAFLVYVLDGRGAWASEGDAGDLVAGDLLCLTPGVWAWHDPDPEAGWSEAWCGFTGPDWERAAGDLFGPTPRVHRLGIDPRLVADFAELRRVMHRALPGWRLEAGAQVMRLLARCRVLRLRPRGGDGLEAACRSLLDELAGAVDRPDVDVHAVARRHRVHYDSLRRRFRALTGLPPKRYHTELRLRRAAGLLAGRPDLPVTAVAAACGWDDPALFSRTFARSRACSPSAWRERERAV